MIMTSADAIAIMILGYLIPATGAYETVKSTNSIIDEPSAQVIE